MQYQIIFISVVLGIGYWLCKHHVIKKRIPAGLKPLPGPKGYPILGSVPDVPEQNSHIKFAEWAKEYGPIYQCNLAGSNHVWISSDEIAKDLLARKGAIYSDRPHIPSLLSDNRTSGQYLPLMSKNDAWTRQRRFATHIMRDSEHANFYRYPELEAKRMLVDLMDDPSRYNHAMESFVSRVTCRLAWGHSEASEELKQRARELLISVSPTGHLGNKLSFVMSLPDWMSPAKVWEKRRSRTELAFFQTMQSQVETDMRNRSKTQSWTRSYLDLPTRFGFKSPTEGAYAVGMHGIAGALTIAAPMQTFCLAMCHYPQYLPMMHEELDRVCGDNLPRAEDRPQLPFLRAMIRECFRWRPPVPSGIPHALTQDDSYNGYHIPAGSVIHPLEWAISRDPTMFPDPETFNPLRWIEPQYPTYREPLTEYPTIINCTQFGYGRRLCQGQAVADEDLLIGIGSLAWLFDITKPGLTRPSPPPLRKYDSLFDLNSPESGYDNMLENPGCDSTSEHSSCPNTSRPSTPDSASAYDLLDPVESSPSQPKSLRTNLELNTSIINSPRYPSSPLSSTHLQTPTLQNPHPAPPYATTPARLLHDETLPSPSEYLDLPGAWHPSFNPEPSPPQDPTLAFSKLLIAKPLPFHFSLTVRNTSRAAAVRSMVEELRAKGEFKAEREFWGPNQGEGRDLGWGKVYI